MKTQKIGVNLCHLWLVLSALIVTANGRAGENLNFARAFGSYMVLQQGQPVPVWGTAKPEAKVTIALRVQKQTAIANTDGRWKTVFPSLKAKGQTLQLTAETAAGKTTLDDILVGEVWLCAGQSNMEWKLSQSASAKTAIPTAKHAQLRLFNFVGAARGGSGDYTPELVAMTRGNWLENKSLEPWCRGRGASNLKRALAADYFIPGDDLGPNHSLKPAFMWDAAVTPLTQMPIAGVLWYQGESNAESEWRVAQHDSVLKTLVVDWRAQWKRPDLPFLFVQLPAMKRPHWSAFRASQQRVHDALPHTGMAVTLDLGHPTDVHPRDKKPVGERLALIAAKQVYGKTVMAFGPVVKSVSRDEDRLILKFESAEGLRTRDGKAPTGFEIRDGTEEWHAVKARIVDGVLELNCGTSKKPAAVRYGWVSFPEPRLNLINVAGLPAAPFSRDVD